MENEITINNIKYFSEEKYLNDLAELEKNLKLQQKEFKVTNYMITDPCNVLAIVPFERDKDIEDNFIINVEGLSKFEKFHDEILFKGKMMKPEKFILKESVYSVELLNKAIKTAKAFNNHGEPEFYLWMNEKNEYEKDRPCLIKLGELVFVLAPRIE